ncbi:MAG: hypothetical protein OXJ90_08470 [Spirochaetaceae bacterium]|nr:hypothetical protein [Spirochaetaceae bacterium]
MNDTLRAVKSLAVSLDCDHHRPAFVAFDEVEQMEAVALAR